MARGKYSKSKKPFAKRSLGQNFLVDANVVTKIINSLGDISCDLVIEIGPGRGALTDLLVDASNSYAAVELDSLFATNLKNRYRDYEKVQIFEEDVLRCSFEKIASSFNEFKDIKIVANLPYNISTAVLERLAKTTLEFDQAVFMFQKEVVSRITAQPGNKNRGYLTLITEANFECEFLFDVRPKAFKPVPRVNSSVVRLRPRRIGGVADSNEFRKILSIGFQQKRKTIANNLKSIAIDWDVKDVLSSQGIDPSLRPERLSLSDWMKLTEAIVSNQN